MAVAAWMVAAAAGGAMGQAAPPYVGQWAVEGPDACRDGSNDDLKASFSTRQLEYYASTCRVVSSRRLSRSGNAAHRLKLTCEGEGILIVLDKTEQRPDLLMHIDAASWETLSYQRCAG
ncbi:hypothetical protein [Undibacter mobilis]|uniref:hypothetical protein n=1 Tax=Undibacter mobilis TaxID=2292256 RepID=UPI0011C0282C|nr:hypothetical protein [Undibacter mobilis]